MNNIVLKNGVIAGLISSLFLIIATYQNYWNNNNYSAYYGFGGMLAGFVFVVYGMYQKRMLTTILWSYGSAFKYGITMVFIASLLYLITWQIIYYGFMPDFADKYADKVIEQLKQKNLSAEELQKQTEGMNKFRESYKNPLFNAGMTFSEIFPVGFFVVLIASAFLMKPLKKNN